MTNDGLPPNGPDAGQGHLAPEDLVAWLDGEATAAEAGRVASHLRACAACRREAAALRESGDLLARLPGLAPSSGFEARVVAASRGGSTSTAPRGRLVFLRSRAAVAAAAVLVAAAAGTWWLAGDRAASGDVLTARDEETLAEDLVVISNLDALEQAEAADLAQLADDLDVIDSLPAEEDG